MRYFLHLGYDGTHFSGWQRQINTQRTVQEVIENLLQNIFKKEITLNGCGRTDSGVHASQYIAHINLETAPTFDFKFRLNKNLPDTIVVFDIVEVQEDQHSRYDATWRTYDYFIHWKKDPTLYRHSSFYENQNLDFDLMHKAVALIAANRDFRALCKHPDLYKNTACNIKECKLYVNEDQGRLRFSITSNRFLRGMIRYCIFFILEVGNKKITLAEFEQVLRQEKILSTKKPAFPNGLFLSRVEYPYINFNNKHYLIEMLKAGLDTNKPS